jgi:predicted nucleic acid-binding protein
MIVDTSVLADIDRGIGTDRLERLEDRRFRVSAASIMETSVGMHRHGVSSEDFEKLLENVEVVPIDSEIAEAAGRLFAKLEDSGDMIEINDYYIAATAAVLEQPVLTGNADHFARIGEIEVVDWNEIGERN